MSHFTENPGSWLTFLNASQQVRTAEKSGVSLSGKAVVYGINLIAVVHHYYQSPIAEKNAVAMKNGGEDHEKRWSSKEEHAIDNANEERNTNTVQGGGWREGRGKEEEDLEKEKK